MKWLSWSLVDPYREIGGAEIHALCVGHHLSKDFGVDFEATNRAEALYDNTFDVIQTHGAALPKKFLRRCLAEKFRSKRPLRVHTLHGESLESMKRLRQWHRVGRWKSLMRELRGCLVADVILAVRDNIRLVWLARLFGKRVVVIENGWDSAIASPVVHETRNARPFETLLEEIDRLSPFGLFVGRDGDPLKAFHRLSRWLEMDSNLRLIAVPGNTLKPSTRSLSCGPLSPRQLGPVYTRARALLMPSAVEGMPLVLLEALSQGTPVIVTDIPAHRALSERGLRHYTFVDHPDDPSAWKRAYSSMPELTPSQRHEAAEWNRARLRTWGQVASAAHAAILETL